MLIEKKCSNGDPLYHSLIKALILFNLSLLDIKLDKYYVLNNRLMTIIKYIGIIMLFIS